MQHFVVGPVLNPEYEVVEVTVGDPMILEVNVTEFNLEIEEVFWTRNGVEIIDGMNSTVIINSSLEAPVGMVALIVDPVESPLIHGGLYQVTVSNSVGNTSSYFVIHIRCKLKFH